MCQRNAVTENKLPACAPQWIKDVVAPISRDERMAEVDARVSARMAMEQDRRSQYLRGVYDCFYIVAFIAWAVYLFWYWKSEE